MYSDGDYYDGQQMDLDDFGCDVVNVEVKLRMEGISVVIIERSRLDVLDTDPVSDGQ